MPLRALIHFTLLMLPLAGRGWFCRKQGLNLPATRFAPAFARFQYKLGVQVEISPHILSELKLCCSISLVWAASHRHNPQVVALSCVAAQKIEYFSSCCDRDLNNPLQILQPVSPNRGEVIWGFQLEPVPHSNQLSFTYNWEQIPFSSVTELFEPL